MVGEVLAGGWEGEVTGVEKRVDLESLAVGEDTEWSTATGGGRTMEK